MLENARLIDLHNAPKVGPMSVDASPFLAATDRADGEVSLTNRERDVLALIAQCYSNQEIADQLYLSINSVKTYIRNAYRRIGVTSRSQAVLWVLTHRPGPSLR